MNLTFVNIHGQPITPGAAKHPKPIKSKKDAPAEWHRGWLVKGFEPGRIDAERELAQTECAKWSAMTEEQRAAAMREGRRAPKEWDEAAFVKSAKRKRVQPRPFEVESSAQQLKAMAERAGWQFVVVTELKKQAL